MQRQQKLKVHNGMDRASKKHFATIEIVIISLLTLALSNSVQAWSARWNPEKPDVCFEKTHNYIVASALEALERQGKLPFSLYGVVDPEYKFNENLFDDEYCEEAKYDHRVRDNKCNLIEGVRAIDYINYGLWWADHPWGRPLHVRNHDDTDFDEGEVVDLMYDECESEGRMYYSDSEIKVGHQVYTAWAKGKQHGEDVTNVALTAWVDMLTSEGNYFMSADNMYHYANDDKVDLVHTDWPGYNGDTIFEENSKSGAGVHVYDYYEVLFEQARDFWPNITERTPSLDAIWKDHYYDTSQTGRLMVEPSEGLWLKASFPSFYMGANPFICHGTTGSLGRNRCEKNAGGRPTWPLWVPKPEKLPLVIDNPSYEKIKTYQEDLVKDNPGKSFRASLIYLGWALHMLTDMGQPDHAMDTTGCLHELFESHASDITIKQGKTLHNDDEENQFPLRDVLDPVQAIQKKSHRDLLSMFLSNGVSKRAQVLGEIAKKKHAYTHRPITSAMNCLDSSTMGDTATRTIEHLLHESILEVMRNVAVFADKKVYRDLEIREPRVNSGSRFSGETIDMYDVSVMGEMDIEISATKNIKLHSGFKAKPGSNVRFYIEE